MKQVKKLSKAQILAFQNKNRKAKEDPNNLKAKEVIINMLKDERSLREIASSLNLIRYTTSRGNEFYPASVLRVIDLYELRSKRAQELNIKIKAKYEKAH